MDNKKLLILGGYGNTGRCLAELLLQESGAHLVLAGRDLQKARDLAAKLNSDYPGDRTSSRYVDASDLESQLEAYRDVDMLVVASSTSHLTREITEAALQTQTDYFDVNFSTSKLELLQKLVARIRESGRIFITDGGFHPGLPAAMVHYTAPHFEHLTSARIGSVIQIDWNSLEFSPETIQEMVTEFMDFSPIAYSQGRWQRVSMLKMMLPETMHFNHGFGRRYCVPMYLEEMRAVPESYPGIEECGFFVEGFNWVTDWLVSPLAMLLPRLPGEWGNRAAGRMFEWSLKRFSKPPYGTLLKLEAVGIQNDKPKTAALSLFHEDGYKLTAIPAVACLLQYLDGSISQPGLHFQANVVEPVRFFENMREMGVEISTEINPPDSEPS
jgi:saccharopine dehydrogenase (NAD+, L-lysine-forming)